MIESHIVLTEADSFIISVRVIAIDRGGYGIKSVRLLDRFRILLHEAIGNCAPVVEFSVDTIARSRLPLFLEGIDCNDHETPGDIPFQLIPGGTGNPGTPGIPVPCSPLFCGENRACSEAEAAVHRARSIIVERCSEVNAARSSRDAYAAATAAMFAFAAAMFGVMAGLYAIPIIGQALGTVALAIAVIALGIAIGLSIRVYREQMKLENAQRELNNARRDFTTTIETVNRVCCAGCISVNLTQPEC